jgi:hypothetical protein
VLRGEWFDCLLFGQPKYAFTDLSRILAILIGQFSVEHKARQSIALPAVDGLATTQGIH